LDSLSDEELAVTRAPKWPYALLVLLVAGLVYVLWRPVGTMIIARQLEAAETAEQQIEALCRLNRWTRMGHAASYRVEALDADGVQLEPIDRARVATLIIVWPGGSRTNVRLLERDASLSCALHG
jgi:hypothetical protein